MTKVTSSIIGTLLSSLHQAVGCACNNTKDAGHAKLPIKCKLYAASASQQHKSRANISGASYACDLETPSHLQQHETTTKVLS
jgi:hypothetical protein